MYRDSSVGSDRNSIFSVKDLFSGSLSPSNVCLRILFVVDEWLTRDNAKALTKLNNFSCTTN